MQRNIVKPFFFADIFISYFIYNTIVLFNFFLLTFVLYRNILTFCQWYSLFNSFIKRNARKIKRLLTHFRCAELKGWKDASATCSTASLQKPRIWNGKHILIRTRIKQKLSNYQKWSNYYKLVCEFWKKWSRCTVKNLGAFLSEFSDLCVRKKFHTICLNHQRLFF